ncbi:NAD-dependent epimerase/dehydratase family protein [Roseomonas xinghualingensis]|uniref:NAD-dependent epimerase/dehydratase family protein n=1 Tax=Roseomonas xinghualingensis TaxID=2986475 RepID=UPI0021F0E640|nr:NAD-dependent epimerase/dehydratase family protein [Roseomonas sp. SXEYE001]MCV4207716.1 NAD-dependent epimerase/dehydratase family protein [Roseomonas sp. SXEYE001]
MRVIVTGAAGFLGGRVASMLAADPRVSAVTGLDRASPPTGAPFQGIVADIARFTELAPMADVVIHAAAITSQVSEADPELAFAINVEGMRAVLRWARMQAVPPRVLLLSSIAVFGRGDIVATEDTQPEPRSTYGTTKLIAERLLLDATRRGEADGVILRLPVSIIRTATRTAPPGAGFVSDLIDAALRGRPFTAPLAPDHAIPVASVEASLGLAMRAGLEAVPGRVLHVPSLAGSADSARAALAACGIATTGIACAPDPAVERLVAGWPARLGTVYPGFSAGLVDPGLEPIILDHSTRIGVPLATAPA